MAEEMDPYHQREVAYERTTSLSTLNWCQEFDSMNLPHFGRQYIQLVHTPLDVMHECLKLQLELQLPEKPSPLSVKQVQGVCGGRGVTQPTSVMFVGSKEASSVCVSLSFLATFLCFFHYNCLNLPDFILPHFTSTCTCTLSHSRGWHTTTHV